eukprot:9409841-Pyramimonas_sp.AAC.1
MASGARNNRDIMWGHVATRRDGINVHPQRRREKREASTTGATLHASSVHVYTHMCDAPVMTQTSALPRSPIR